MADMIPARQIAAIVQTRVAEAEASIAKLDAYGSSERNLEAAKRSLAAASELLALIAPPQVAAVDPPEQPPSIDHHQV